MDVDMVEEEEVCRDVNLLLTPSSHLCFLHAPPPGKQDDAQDGAQTAAEWMQRRAEMDTAPRVDEDRPKRTGGTVQLPSRHWR